MWYFVQICVVVLISCFCQLKKILNALCCADEYNVQLVRRLLIFVIVMQFSFDILAAS